MYNSSCVNKVILLGLVTTEPSWHVIDRKRSLTFTMVTEEMFKKGGKSVDHQEWHQIRVPEDVMVDITIEKGVQVYVQGKLQTRQVKDENGIKHYYSEIIANIIEVMSFVAPQAGADEPPV
jgi:single-strand DNA-binding protein